MTAIGFEEERGRHFKHPESEQLVEFLPDPPTVGEDPVSRIDEIPYTTGILRIISPTDCVKDRLAGYYHWQDRQSLLQAALVARENEVDLSEIEQWSRREGKLDKFTEFRVQLSTGDLASGD
jgi:hypothetical protein